VGLGALAVGSGSGVRGARGWLACGHVVLRRAAERMPGGHVVRSRGCTRAAPTGAARRLNGPGVFDARGACGAASGRGRQVRTPSVPRERGRLRGAELGSLGVGGFAQQGVAGVVGVEAVGGLGGSGRGGVDLFAGEAEAAFAAREE